MFRHIFIIYSVIRGIHVSLGSSSSYNSSPSSLLSILFAYEYKKGVAKTISRTISGQQAGFDAENIDLAIFDI